MRALLSAPATVLQAAAPGGRKRTRQDAAEAAPPRVRLTIEGCSVKEAALFLRFLYHPEQISAASMGKLGGDLPAVGPATFAPSASPLGILLAKQAALHGLTSRGSVDSPLAKQVARLAHKFDVPAVLAAAEAWLTAPEAGQDPKQVRAVSAG